MSKKQTAPKPAPAAPKPKDAPALAAIDDFFTQFLDKRRKYFVTKMEEIKELEAREAATLKPDQREKVNKKAETQDRIKYFDDIKTLYAEAHAKKGVEPAKGDAAGAVDDLANLFALGHAISHFARNSKNFEHTFNSDQMTAVQDAFHSLTHLHSAADLENTKAKLQEYSKNEELRKATASFLDSYQWEKDAHTQRLEEPQYAHPEHKGSGRVEHLAEDKPKQKRRLFADHDDEEDEAPPQQSHKKPEGHSGKHKEAAQEGGDEETGQWAFLAPLPEGDDKKGDEFQNSRGKKQGNRNYGPRPPRDQNRQRREGGQEEGQNQEGERRPLRNNEGEGRPPRKYDDKGRPPRNYDREGRPPRNQDGEGNREGWQYRQKGEGRGERSGHQPRGDGEGQGERRKYPRREGSGRHEGQEGSGQRRQREQDSAQGPQGPQGGKPQGQTGS